jgi:hypothetical protein
MKKLFKFYALVLILTSTLSGCKNDDDDSGDNYFNVDNTRYELSGGEIGYEKETTLSGAYWVDLILYSEGITPLSIEEATGKGNILSFILFSSQKTDLPSGVYTYNSTAQDANTFSQSAYMLNFDTATKKSDSESNFKSGTVTIAKSGSVYEITINGTTENGKTITGHYKGILTSYTR